MPNHHNAIQRTAAFREIVQYLSPTALALVFNELEVSDRSPAANEFQDIVMEALINNVGEEETQSLTMCRPPNI